MKNDHRTASALILVLLAGFSAHRCGTETGNPNLDPVDVDKIDLTDARFFFSGSTSVDAAGGKSRTGASKGLGEPSDPSRSSLFKITLAGDVAPAVTVREADVPTVIRMTKAQGDYFLLFDRFMDLGVGGTCSLLRVSGGTQASCVDSRDHPAAPRAENGQLTFPNDQLLFLVSVTDDGALYPGADGALWRNSSGVTLRFGPAGWSFERAIRAADGEVYGLGCEDAGGKKYLACRVRSGGVLPYSFDIGSLDMRLFALEGDRLLVVADPGVGVDLHLREGPTGATVDAANFTIDYKAGLSPDEIAITEDIVSVFRIPPPALWAGTYAVSEGAGHSVCVFWLDEGITIGRECAPSGYGTFGSVDFQPDPSRLVFSWIKDKNTCEILRYKLTDPPSSPISPYYLKLLDCDDLNSLPTMIRFMGEEKFVFGGPEKGPDPDRYYYYTYEFTGVTSGQATPLIDSARPLVFFPL